MPGSHDLSEEFENCCLCWRVFFLHFSRFLVLALIADLHISLFACNVDRSQPTRAAEEGSLLRLLCSFHL
jgi:hypothetical protein